MTSKHRKIHGFVEDVDSDYWYCRVQINGEEYYVSFAKPLLPNHAQPGSLFTIHTTKRGHTYFYWPSNPMTKRQLKKARIRARQLMKALGFDDTSRTPPSHRTDQEGNP